QPTRQHRSHRFSASPISPPPPLLKNLAPVIRSMRSRRDRDRAAFRSHRCEEPSLSERDKLSSFAMELADEADKIAMRYFRRDLRIDRKPDRTFVTQADTAVEKALRERIEQRYPGHGVLAAEFGDRTAKQATRWVSDPIDATHSYLRGIP